MFHLKYCFSSPLKIEVLIDLRFFSEAFHEMSQIFYGRNMPSLIPAGSKATGKVKVNLSVCFRTIALPFEDCIPKTQGLLPHRCIYTSLAL